MKVAIFEIIDTFRITGRGGVLVGNLIEGNFGKGDFIYIFDKFITIKAIEMISIRNPNIRPEEKVAFSISFKDYDEIKDLEIKNKTFDIFE
ncbi:hypothetical protein AD998_07150 [bacterium 336/3]|nr:hypothetical protein AD998_07150 [bacterium 336/3]